CVSRGPDGQPRNASRPAISADGRFVAFESQAPDLVSNDVNGTVDVFVHDRDADENGVFDEEDGTRTVRVSVDAGGHQGDADSRAPVLSADGRFVAFWSFASNLVADAPGPSRYAQVYVHDRDVDDDGVFDQPGHIATRLMSVAHDGRHASDGGASAPTMSADGRFVAFSSSAEDLVADTLGGNGLVYLRDRDSDRNGIFDEPGGVATGRVSAAPDGTPGDSFGGDVAVLAAGGGVVVFRSTAGNLIAGDTNGVEDVFAADLSAGAVERVSINSEGLQADDASPRRESFSDLARSAVSADGRFVVFESEANNLVPADRNAARDVFVHDRMTGATTLLSLAPDGTQFRTASDTPAISGDGRVVVF